MKQVQRSLRKKIINLYKKANAGHIGCSLSCIDIVYVCIALCKKEQETFILSKGHAAVSLYTVLNNVGEISGEDLSSYYVDGTNLPAHPAPNKYKGIPFALGSLGHGLPIGTGIAQANKLLNQEWMSYVLMSDGETNEGTTWEAMHYAVANKLDNLMVIIDKNGIQGFDYTKNVIGDSAKATVWSEIGFDVLEVDGHNIDELEKNINLLRNIKNEKPKLIIANTVKGKGISYMENTIDWHYLPMNDEQYRIAMSELV